MNESTAGADALVEVSELHNIKLLAISIALIQHTLYHDEYFTLISFAACKETQRVGNDRP